jgi:hypothetical protein
MKKDETNRTFGVLGQRRNAHRVLVKKVNRALRCKWENNIKLDIK